MDVRLRCAIWARVIWTAAVLLAAQASGWAQEAEPAAASEPVPAIVALEDAFVRVIEGSEPAVVSIARISLPGVGAVQRSLNPFEAELRNRVEQPDSPDFVPNEYGAGILLTPADAPNERVVLTNYHVVTGGPATGSGDDAEVRLYIRFTDHRGCDATIFAADPRSDLAILKLDPEAPGIDPRQLPSLTFGDASTLKKGQFVVALGNPYAIARDGSPSATWGIISNIARQPGPPRTPNDANLDDETIHHLGTLLQLDARLEFGTSGGALLNLKGDLIGMTTALAALDGYEKAMGYAVPFDARMRRIINELMLGREVEYGFLGVQPKDVVAAELQRYSGTFNQPAAAMAASVFENSPAAIAGIRSGDLILALNDKPVLTKYDLMREVAFLEPESPMRVQVWRESENTELQVNVTLGKWPVRDDAAIVETNPRRESWRGLTIDYPTGRYRFLPYPPRCNDAVLVTKVAAASPGDLAELHAGDFVTHVDGKSVRTPAEFHAAIQELDGEVTLSVLGRDPVVVAN